MCKMLLLVAQYLKSKGTAPDDWVGSNGSGRLPEEQHGRTAHRRAHMRAQPAQVLDACCDMARHALQRMHHPHDTTGGLRVPNPALGRHCGEWQRAQWAGHPSDQGPHLDGVAQGGCRAVQVQRRQCVVTTLCQCGAHDRRLQGPRGGGQRGGASVLIGRRGSQQDGSGCGGGSGAQQQHAAGFRAHVAVCRRVQGLAAPLHGQHARLLKHRGGGGGELDRHAADHCVGRRAAKELSCSKVRCDQ